MGDQKSIVLTLQIYPTQAIEVLKQFLVAANSFGEQTAQALGIEFKPIDTTKSIEALKSLQTAAGDLSGTEKTTASTTNEVGAAVDAAADKATTFSGSAQNLFFTLGAGTQTLSLLKNTLGEWIDKSNEAEQMDAKLDIALKTAGDTTDDGAQKLRDYAAQQEKVTGVNRDQIVNAEAMIVSMTGLTGDAVIPATKAALDYAAATGTDVTSAVENMARVVDTGTGKFGKFKVDVSDAVGQAGRWQAVIDLVNQHFSGFADYLGGKGSGQMKVFSDEVDHAEESLGHILVGILVPILPAIEDVLGAIEHGSPLLDAAAAGVGALTIAYILLNTSVLTVAASFITNLIPAIEEVTVALMANPWTAVATGIAAVLAAIVYLYERDKQEKAEHDKFIVDSTNKMVDDTLAALKKLNGEEQGQAIDINITKAKAKIDELQTKVDELKSKTADPNIQVVGATGMVVAQQVDEEATKAVKGYNDQIAVLQEYINKLQAKKKADEDANKAAQTSSQSALEAMKSEISVMQEGFDKKRAIAKEEYEASVAALHKRIDDGLQDSISTAQFEQMKVDAANVRKNKIGLIDIEQGAQERQIEEQIQTALLGIMADSVQKRETLIQNEFDKQVAAWADELAKGNLTQQQYNDLVDAAETVRYQKSLKNQQDHENARAQVALNAQKARLDLQKTADEERLSDQEKIALANAKTESDRLEITRDFALQRLDIEQKSDLAIIAAEKNVLEAQKATAADDELQNIIDKLDELNAKEAAVKTTTTVKKETVQTDYTVGMDKLGNSGDVLAQQKVVADAQMKLQQAVTDDQKKQAQAQLLNEQKKLDGMVSANKRASEQEKQMWLDQHQVAQAAIDAIDAGFKTAWTNMTAIHRQAKDDGDAIWISMESTALDALGKILEKVIINAATSAAMSATSTATQVADMTAIAAAAHPAAIAESIASFGVADVTGAGAYIAAVGAMNALSLGGMAFAKGGKVTSPTISLSGDNGPEWYAPEKDFIQMAREELIPKVLSNNISTSSAKALNRDNNGMSNAEVITNLKAISSALSNQQLVAKIQNRELLLFINRAKRQDSGFTF